MQPRTVIPRAIFAAVVAFVPALTPDWAVAGEDELILAVEPGYSALDSAGGVDHGLGLAASAWLGTEGPLWLAASTGLTGQFGVDDPLALEAMVGLVYAFDVFVAIPFLEAQGGFVYGPAFRPTARFGLGLDYLVTRTVSIGAVGRIRPLGDPLGNALITAHLRIAVRLEY